MWKAGEGRWFEVAVCERLLLKWVPYLCSSFQDALTVYKEAIQKMPRQFAPQSLYNMMGKCGVSRKVFEESDRVRQKSLARQMNEPIKQK